jgi:sialate O-acetylesterase
MQAAGAAVAITGATVDASGSPGAPAQSIFAQSNAKPGSLPYPGNAKADIWVFSGQSNSQGWSLLKAPVAPDPRIMFLNSENEWVVAREPLNHLFYNWTPAPVEDNIRLQRDNLNFSGKEVIDEFLRQMKQEHVRLGGVGPALFFAKHLVNYIDRPIGLMHCGVGGSPIKSWDPSLRTPGKLTNYEAMIKRIALVGGNIRGLIWYQGESDAMTDGADDTYEEALLRLIDSTRRDTGIPDLPFLCVQIGRFVWAYNSHGRGFENIRDIQRRAAAQRKNVYAVSALDLPLEDAAHLSYEGYQRLGPRLAEVALTGVYQQAGHATPIDLESIQVLQPDNRRPMVRIRFKGVNGRLRSPGLPTGFELRSKLPPVEPRAPSADFPIHVVYRVDFDPNDPAALILGVFDNAMINSGGRKHYSLEEPFSIVYGPGMSPYVNIVDEKDIPIPAFGPVDVGRTS